jgi:heat shock protein HslJ
MMACEEAIMEQEAAYLKALAEVKTFAISGEQLTRNDADKKGILVYQMQSQDLAGTSWEVTSYNNGKQAVVSALTGSSLTVVFNEDGTISGSGGCNNFNGSYEVDGSAITIGPLASTLMACEQDVMDQEAAYLAALQSAATYQVEGSMLEVRTKDGALAIIATAASTPGE